VLGGLTQAQRALVAKPTFATIWIGNNDILAYALNGTPQFATPQATFVSNYNAMMTQLMAGAPTLKGVLMGVVQVALAPQLFPAAALANPQFVAGLSVAVGKQVLVHPDCLAGPGAQSLINIQIVSALRTAPVPMIVCAKGDVPGAGDVGILDVDEQAFVQNTVNGYNAYIKAKADSLGWAYWDPNTVLTQLKATGAVSTVPNLASSTAPFGTAISLDGVHPSASGHIAIANALIQTINAKFNTSIPAISQ
jgi:lysophospholipase L1-like esterase